MSDGINDGHKYYDAGVIPAGRKPVMSALKIPEDLQGSYNGAIEYRKKNGPLCSGYGAGTVILLIEHIAALEEQNAAMQALMELACADIIFFHSGEEGPFIDVGLPKNVAFSVLVNDIFFPAADAEGFDLSEAIPLRDVFRKDGYEGVIRWVQAKRDNAPLRPHAEKRIKEKEDLRKENSALKDTISVIRAVASGEHQVAADDTEGMAWIDRYIAARAAKEQL